MNHYLSQEMKYSILLHETYKTVEIPGKNKKNWRTIEVNANNIRGKQAAIENLKYNLISDVIIVYKKNLLNSQKYF